MLERLSRRDLFNPWAWVRLSFERVVGFPSYILGVAGFGPDVTNSTRVRVGGLATVASAIVAVLAYLRGS